MRLIVFLYDNNRHIFYSVKQLEQRENQRKPASPRPPRIVKRGAFENYSLINPTEYISVRFLDDLFPTCSGQRFVVLRVPLSAPSHYLSLQPSGLLNNKFSSSYSDRPGMHFPDFWTFEWEFVSFDYHSYLVVPVDDYIY